MHASNVHSSFTYDATTCTRAPERLEMMRRNQHTYFITNCRHRSNERCGAVLFVYLLIPEPRTHSLLLANTHADSIQRACAVVQFAGVTVEVSALLLAAPVHEYS